MTGNKRFFIRTYGCQMNFYDEGIVREILAQEGYEPSKSEEDASLLLVLTCSVRRHAERRALGYISSLRRLKDQRKIGVLGCLSSALKEKLFSYGADFILGPDEYRKLPEALRGSQVSTPDSEFPCETYGDILPKASGVKAFLSIMRGCDNFCSYCIVPYVRGRERSKEFSAVIKEANSLVAAGVREITLLGQNVLSYHSGGLAFLDVLKELDRIDGLKRIRFLTSHPKDLSLPLIGEMAKLVLKGKLCPEFHLPLQSGSNKILSLMRRGYTREEYWEKIAFLRLLLPFAAVTTDLMVGFPGEEEKDFEETMEMVESIRFDFAYMFKYSERPNTKALEIEGKVSEEVKRRRLSHLISVQNKITREKSEETKGKVYEVLIEDRVNGEFKGKTPQGKVVIVKTKEPLSFGEVYKVRVVELSGWTPIAVLENEHR